MTTTLQNGTKIPDKYSRDWYADLSTNWNLLDNLIGQFASGTFQHDVIPSTTNTYKLGSSTNIWDAVYGNAYYLGTTPFGDIVTHNASEFAATGDLAAAVQQIGTNTGDIATKAADSAVVHLAGAETITGDKTWTGLNTFQYTVVFKDAAAVSAGGYGVGLGFFDYAGNRYGYIQPHIMSDGTKNIVFGNSASGYLEFASYLIPYANNVIGLGTSANAWAAIYAQSYYYGGTEFSDKFWTADTVQSFTASKHLKAYNLKVGQGESYGRTGYSLVWTDKNDVPVGYIESFKNANAARTVLRIRAGDYYTNGTPDSEGTQVIASLRVGTLANSTRVIEAEADAVYPATNNATDLGTSSNKWKTLNGINPGALSFPRTGTTANTDYIDVSGGIDLTTTSVQTLTASATGWLCLSFAYNKVTSCQLSAGNYRTQTGPLGTSGYVGCCIPVTEGQTVNIRVDATALYSARIYLCQGNV